MRFFSRPPRVWEIKITSPEGELLHVTTDHLDALWRDGDRSTDGYAEILRMPRVHLWARPRGWTEPDSRLAQLDGTAAVLPGKR